MEVSDTEDSSKCEVMLPAFRILMNDPDIIDSIEFKPNVMDLQPKNLDDPGSHPVTEEQINQLKLLCRAWLTNFTQYREECLRHCITKLHTLLLEQIRQERMTIRAQYIAQLESNRSVKPRRDNGVGSVKDRLAITVAGIPLTVPQSVKHLTGDVIEFHVVAKLNKNNSIVRNNNKAHM
ncbi:hypothetical protein FO519_007124 [Halicephalobus sp. NKZ332]|nr:hypothetical protein FO519_007124 [Halicephalobus sp. NKZ332]